jgi:DNA-binding response OmpR family regulator
MLASALRSDGYEVVETPNGVALLEEISLLLFRGEALPADLIISDERMPGVLGSEVLAGLRGASWPVPFILITGFGDEGTRREAYRLGASAVFDKPFDLDDLRRSILQLLRGDRDSGSSTRGGDSGSSMDAPQDAQVIRRSHAGEE